MDKCHALLPGVPIFTTKNDESWWRMEGSKCRYNMLCMDPMALATYRDFFMLFITCYFSRAFNNDLFWELLSKLRKFKPESLLEHDLLLPFLGPGSLVHPRRLTARTRKWWLGSDDSPLPGGPYSQVPAVNLSGCNNFWWEGAGDSEVPNSYPILCWHKIIPVTKQSYCWWTKSCATWDI